MNKIPNWYIITGGPSSRKTTVINELKDRGYKMVVESARNYIEIKLINGRDIEEVRLRQYQLQHKILDRQVDIERNLDPEELTFLDRATPDSLACYQYLGLPADEKLIEWVKTFKFKKVFILDLLPLVNDEIRLENRGEQLVIHNTLIEVYKKTRGRNGFCSRAATEGAS
jgi:predicted ATPase